MIMRSRSSGPWTSGNRMVPQARRLTSHVRAVQEGPGAPADSIEAARQGSQQRRRSWIRPADAPPAARIGLRQLLMVLGDSLVEVQAAPAGLDVEIREVSLLDPEDPRAAQPDELVLVIGARGRAAFPALRAAGRDGAASRGEAGRARPPTALSERPRPRPGSPCSRCAAKHAGSRSTASRPGPPSTTHRRVSRAWGPRRATCSLSPRPPPSSPAAWSASRTPRTGCWPTPAPPTPTRRTTCAGAPSSAGRDRKGIWRSCASGACSSTCTPATR
ncbi:hypothetical protein SVIOM74S_02526 [Streptomyces violarus]